MNVDENIYVPKSFGEDEIEVIFSYLDVAVKRNIELFGSVEGHPVIIFTDDVSEAVDFRGNYVGATHNSVFGLYIIIGPNGYNEDIVSHEFAHSELSARVGWYKTNKIPIWFNEGVATQVDYRRDYSLESWNELTNGGTDIKEVKKLNKPKDFYVQDIDLRIDNYVLARHEVRRWYELVGTEGLIMSIERFKNGEDIYDVYMDLLLENSRELRD